MAVCDGGRAISRLKSVPQSPRALPPRPFTSESLRRPDQHEVTSLRRRLRQAEDRSSRQRRLMEFASAALLLLRDIFGDLRSQKMIAGEGDVTNSVGKQTTAALKPAEVLDRIAHRFVTAVPTMGNFSELQLALAEELAGRVSTQITTSEDVQETPRSKAEPDSQYASENSRPHSKMRMGSSSQLSSADSEGKADAAATAGDEISEVPGLKSRAGSLRRAGSQIRSDSSRLSSLRELSEFDSEANAKAKEVNKTSEAEQGVSGSSELMGPSVSVEARTDSATTEADEEEGEEEDAFDPDAPLTPMSRQRPSASLPPVFESPASPTKPATASTSASTEAGTPKGGTSPLERASLMPGSPPGPRSVKTLGLATPATSPLSSSVASPFGSSLSSSFGSSVPSPFGSLGSQLSGPGAGNGGVSRLTATLSSSSSFGAGRKYQPSFELKGSDGLMERSRNPNLRALDGVALGNPGQSRSRTLSSESELLAGQPPVSEETGGSASSSASAGTSDVGGPTRTGPETGSL